MYGGMDGWGCRVPSGEMMIDEAVLTYLIYSRLE